MTRIGSYLAARLTAIAAVAALVACESHKSSEAAPQVELSGKTVKQKALLENGDFESDGIHSYPITGWTVSKYLNSVGVTGSELNPPTTVSALNLQTSSNSKLETFVEGGATASQFDPDLGDGEMFRFPIYGQRAARINLLDDDEHGQNKNVNALSQTYTIATDGSELDIDGLVHIRFAVAPVLENPEHPYEQQPYFFVQVQNVTKDTTLYTMFNRAGESGVPWHSATGVRAPNYAVQWLDWQLVDIAPGTGALDSGDTVKLTIIAAGCQPGGHFGRVYVDGVGTTIPGTYVSATAPTDVVGGQQLTYTLHYANGGTSDATSVSIRMAMPPQTTFSSTTGNCTGSDPITCTLPDLAPGDSGTFTVTVTVDLSARDTIVNGDYAISSTEQPTLLGNKVTTLVHPPCEDSSTCLDNTPICNLVLGQCDACTTNTECQNDHPTTPFCSSPGACVECLQSTDCTDATKPICSQSTFTCGGCTSGSQCVARDSTQTICDTDSGSCFVCPALPAAANGTIDVATGAETGDTRTYACNQGYTLSGTAARTCQADGTWTDVAPTCTANSCSETLTAPANGSITPTTGEGTTGSSVTYSCNAAYELADGTASRTCQPDGTWSGTAPSCTQVPGACTSDAMCDTATEWCDIQDVVCRVKLVNGTPMPTDSGHSSPTLDGTCAAIDSDAAVLVCQSKVCDVNDNGCGLAFGDGPCDTTNASVICRAGVCGDDDLCGYANGKGPCTTTDEAMVCRSQTCSSHAPLCRPVGGCAVDADCSATEWCNTETFQCKPKLDNSEDIPTVANHDPVLDHTCTSAVAAAVCASGVCYSDTNQCGLPDGVGPCDSESSALNVCRSGNCSANGGVCIPAAGCAVDADCDVTTHYCNTETLSCAPKVINGNSIPIVAGHDPALTGLCSADVGVSVCSSNVCSTSDDLCGYPSLEGPCDASTAGTVCRSSVCSPTASVCIPADGCAVDGDCATTEWCDRTTLACTPKLANGTPIPTQTGHTPDLTGTCTTDAATAVCESGVCDTTDNKCGYADGNGSCTSNTATDVCRSGTCSTTGVCQPAQGCLVDVDCDTTVQFCTVSTKTCTTKVTNGNPIPNDPGHSPSLTGICTTDAASIVCASGACDTVDNLCGHGGGQGPCDATNAALVCRSGVCAIDGDFAGTCVECTDDSHCGGSTPACDVTTETCVQCTDDSSAACAGATPICSSQHQCVATDPASDPTLAAAGSGLVHGCAETSDNGYAVFMVLAFLVVLRRRR